MASTKHEIKRTRIDFEAGWEAARDKIYAAYDGLPAGTAREALWELYRYATGRDQRMESAERYADDIHGAEIATS